MTDTPQKAAIEALASIEELAHVKMELSLADWQRIINPVVRALELLRTHPTQKD